MIDQLRAQFLPQFLEVADRRLARILELAGRGLTEAAQPLAMEFHALAGESSLLCLTEVSQHASAGEAAAKKWRDGDAASQVACLRAARGLQRALTALKASAPAAPAPAATTPAAKSQVLVVDDSSLNAQILGEALEAAGFTVRTASTLAEAVTATSALRPDVVIADVNMPDCDVRTLCAQVRAAAQGGETRVVLVSALPEAELAGVAAEAGADGWVTKERSVDAVVAGVRAQLGAR